MHRRVREPRRRGRPAAGGCAPLQFGAFADALRLRLGTSRPCASNGLKLPCPTVVRAQWRVLRRLREVSLRALARFKMLVAALTLATMATSLTTPGCASRSPSRQQELQMTTQDCSLLASAPSGTPGTGTAGTLSDTAGGTRTLHPE